MTEPTLQKTTAATMLVDLFNFLGDFQFEHRPINGGDLVEQLGAWMGEHADAFYALCAGDQEPGLRALKSFFIKFRDLQDDEKNVNGGDLVEDVGAWLESVGTAMPLIVGGPFVAQVARSADGEHYWSDTDGWGYLEDATAFFVTPAALLQSQAAGSLSVVELAPELLEVAQRWVEEAAEAPRG
ncbi:hypothetical protein [Variovorax gossypii]|uniref:hypothetical protein n=1 Tax=uncultured Variovorax sp. TaxID=114708 RepID=UPI0026139203|nr:hypothetical protein [uncultured Variovorax sp.]